VGSPITFSGFNSIDFGVVLTSIMQQESQPLTALQSRQTAVQTQITNFATLATKTATLEGAAAALSTAQSLSSFTATSSDPAAVGVSSAGTAIAGHYDIKVNELARAQVTASASSSPDASSTAVASGGVLTINGTAVPVGQGMTLNQLAAAINADPTLAASASVIQDGVASFRLVLTAKATGLTNGFSVTNTLTGGSGLSFTDTDLDGTSGDTAADNAVQATNASLTVNNIAVTSASNTLDAVIPGSTLTVYKKDPAVTIAVDVASSTADLKNRLSGFILAYNDLVKFVGAQTTAAGTGDPSSIARDPLVRQLRNTLRSTLSASYGGGSTNNLSQLGVEFVRNTGTLTLKDDAFAAATAGGTAGLPALFAGTAGTPGVFASINSILDGYTHNGGFLSSVQAQLNTQVSHMSSQITHMQERLALRRAALQREFTAADTAMTQLKSQGGSLASFGAASA
jgi:flagellar hook-associated protein 2